MAVTLDASPGGIAANSYITLEDALTYITDVRLEDPPLEWTAADANKQKKALIRATTFINACPFPGRAASWRGASYQAYTRVVVTWGQNVQALFFPRMTDINAIPKPVQQATVELALYLIARPGDAVLRENLQAQGVASVQLGRTTETYRARTGRSVIDECPVVVGLLREVGYGAPVRLG